MKTTQNTARNKNQATKRLLLAKIKRKKLYMDSTKLNQPNSELLGEIKVKTERVEISPILVMWITSLTNQHLE